MANIETLIAWFNQRAGRVTYSMSYRNGPGSYDCSSAVYYGLQAAGFRIGHIGNTESMFRDLPALGFTRVPAAANGYIAARRGDIFIWGAPGQSAGAAGHTGVFVDADNIIHCNYGYNGITVNNHDAIWSANGQPPVAIYRYAGKSSAPASAPAKGKKSDGPRWIVERGDTLAKIAAYYGIPGKVNEIAKYNGIKNPNAIAPGQTIYIPGPLEWNVDPGDTWEKIDRYYGYTPGAVKSRNPGKTLKPGTVLNIWN